MITHGIELALAVTLIGVGFCLNDGLCSEINSAVQLCSYWQQKFKECNGSPVKISSFIYPSFHECSWAGVFVWWTHEELCAYPWLLLVMLLKQ